MFEYVKYLREIVGSELEVWNYCKQVAGNRHGEAQFWQNFCYAECLRAWELLPQDLNEAVRYYKLAAGNGIAKAALIYTKWCEEGTVIPKDMEHAEKYYKIAHNGM